MPNKIVARKRPGRPPANKSSKTPSIEQNSSIQTETPSKRLKRSKPIIPNPVISSSSEEEEKYGSKKYGCPRSSILKATCKPQTFNSFFKEKLETKLRPIHWELISETPFCHFFDLPSKWVVSNAVLHLLLECWNPEKDAFIFKGNKLKFTAKDVGIVLGLKHTGSLVSEMDAKQKGSNEIHSKYFGNKRHISRQEIEKVLLQLVDLEEKSTDFVKVLVLYLFAMVLFPMTQNKVDGYFARYLDSIENLKNYSWAGAVFMQLDPQITSQSNWVCGRGEGQTYLKGCSLALQVWFYEHIDQAKLRVGLELIPRMFNWNLAEQHQRSGSFMKLLDRIPKGKVNGEALVPTDDEKIILKEGLFNSTLAQSIVSQRAPPQLALPMPLIGNSNLICNSNSQIEKERITQIDGVKQECGIAEGLKEGIVEDCREDGIVGRGNMKKDMEEKFESGNVQNEEMIVHNLSENMQNEEVIVQNLSENMQNEEVIVQNLSENMQNGEVIVRNLSENMRNEEIKVHNLSENVEGTNGRTKENMEIIDDFIRGDNGINDEKRELELKDTQNEVEIMVEKLSENNIEISHEYSKGNVEMIEGDQESSKCEIDDFIICDDEINSEKNADMDPQIEHNDS